MNRRARIITASSVLLGIVLVSAAGSAQSLEQSLETKQNVARNDKFLQDAVKDVNRVCGTSITASGAWETFGGKIRDGGTYPGLNCSQALTGLTRVCNPSRGDAAKQAVQAQIKTFVCTAASEDAESMTLGSGTLAYKTRLGLRHTLDVNESDRWLTKSLSSGGVSLSELQQRKSQEDMLQSSIKDLNHRCGSTIAVRIDWPSWNGNIRDEHSHTAGAICSGVVSDIGMMCGNKDVKSAVQKGITSVVCKGGGTGDTSSIALDGTNVVYTGALAQTKRAETKKYLMDHLTP